MPSANDDARRPPEDPLGLGEVALEAADVDAAAAPSGHGTQRDAAAGRRRRRWVSRAISASVSESGWPRLKISPAASGVVAASDEGVDDVVDVHAVAPLRAVAEQHDVLAEQRLADEHRQEAEALALEVLARARRRS